MPNVVRVTVMGHVAGVKETKNGYKVVSVPMKDRKTEETQWYSVILKETYEVDKGDFIYIEGTLKLKTYNDKVDATVLPSYTLIFRKQQ